MNCCRSAFSPGLVAIFAALFRTLPPWQRGVALLPHREFGPADIHRAAERRHDRHSAAHYRARAKAGILTATVGYVITRSLNLYIGERARSRHQIWVYSIQQVFGPSAGSSSLALVLIKLLGQSAEWPLRATRSHKLVATLIVLLPKIGHGAASGRSIARSSDTPCGTASR